MSWMTLHVRDIGDGPVAGAAARLPLRRAHVGGPGGGAAAAGWRVLVPDLPGFGASAAARTASPSLDVVADAVLGMLDERGVDRCVVGGISLGGYVAMALLRARPDLAAGLLLCDTKATADADAARENRERLALRCLAAPGETARILEQAVLPGLLGDTTRADAARGRRAGARLARRRRRQRRSRGTSARWRRARTPGPSLAAAHVPVLVVWGDEDALSPRAEQDLMLAAAAGADLVVVEGAGHLAQRRGPGRRHGRHARPARGRQRPADVLISLA